MITTINPVNICLYTQLKIFLFLWWGLLNISSINNFQTWNTVLTTDIILYIKLLWLTYFITGSLYSLTISHSPILPILHCLFQATTNLFCVPMSLLLSYFVYKWDHIVFVFFCLTFHLAKYRLDPPMDLECCQNWQAFHFLWKSFIFHFL